MAGVIANVIFLGIEWLFRRGKLTEEEWKAYKEFIRVSQYWRKLPSAKKTAARNRWKRLEKRRKDILEKMKKEGKI